MSINVLSLQYNNVSHILLCFELLGDEALVVLR